MLICLMLIVSEKRCKNKTKKLYIYIGITQSWTGKIKFEEGNIISKEFGKVEI